eukprot:TRINITY_DN24943_c0_g1_i1.p1 TRINITY_DN24943_c0_g1~~TRINITY_DN24943_c0_g1_i1.p1  ORF type:complete len:1168 (-),score=240.58 TRINITY_DN24943_c0_g1_i1:211-3714(-)
MTGNTDQLELHWELVASTKVRSNTDDSTQSGEAGVEVTGYQGKHLQVPFARAVGSQDPFPSSWPYGSADFRRRNEADDRKFYEEGASMVTHIDAQAVAALQKLYALHFALAEEGDFSILEINSSWVSHFPPDLSAKRVAVLGMVSSELNANKQATEATVQNVNTHPKLPYGSNEFDFVTCIVSVQNFTKPDALFHDIHRVLKPGGVALISFHTRAYAQKAIAMWLADVKDGPGHCQIVRNYFHFSPRAGWEHITSLEIAQAKEPMWVVSAVKSKELGLPPRLRGDRAMDVPPKPMGPPPGESAVPPAPPAQELPSLRQAALEAEFVERSLKSAIPKPDLLSGWLLCYGIRNVLPRRLAKAALGTGLRSFFWKKRFVEVDGSELRCWTASPEPGEDRQGHGAELLLTLPLREVDEVVLVGRVCSVHCRHPQVLLQCTSQSDGEAERWTAALQGAVAYALSSSLPKGWDVQAMLSTSTSTKRLVHKETLAETAGPICQRLVDHCYVCKGTKDRRGKALPFRLQLEEVIRVQNGAAWMDYNRARSRVAGSTPPPDSVAEAPLADESNGGTIRRLDEVPVLTTTLQNTHLLQLLGGELDTAANEQWLFHGTSAAGVQGISDEEFRLDFAGSHRGTLYGKGIYLAECSSKADEYSEQDEHGFCYMLLCRTTLGNVLECADKQPKKDILDRCRTSGYNSLCGDRWTAVNTFREFVLFDPNQVYPAFILRYRRWDEAKLAQTIRQSLEKRNQEALSRLVPIAALLADEYPDQTVRYRLALLLGANPGLVPDLCRCMTTDHRFRFRRAAVLALIQIAVNSGEVLSQGRAIPALIEGLTDSNGEIRMHAARALQKLGDYASAAVPSLILCLGDEDSRTREASATALGHLASHASSAVPALLELTGDQNEHVRKSSLLALGRIGHHSAGVQVETLQRCLKDDSSMVRRAAATALGELREQRGAVAIQDLVLCLKDSEANVRKAAVGALGVFGSAAAPVLSDVATCMKDVDQHVREATAVALKYLGTHAASAAPAIMEGLRDGSPQVRQASAAALGRLWSRDVAADSSAVQILVSRGLSDSVPEVRAAAAEVLADMASLNQLGSLKELVEGAMTVRIKDCEESVRSYAQCCLDHLRPPSKEESKSWKNQEALQPNQTWRRTEGQMVRIKAALDPTNGR